MWKPSDYKPESDPEWHERSGLIHIDVSPAEIYVEEHWNYAQTLSSVYLFDKENEMVLSLCLLTVYRSCTELKISQSMAFITPPLTANWNHWVMTTILNDVYLRILNACNVFIFLIVFDY